jgi:hypothetical protein
MVKVGVFTFLPQPTPYLTSSGFPYATVFLVASPIVLNGHTEKWRAELLIALSLSP